MKRSLIAQINTVQDEIDQREKVYPRIVSKGKMRQSEADHRIADMRAVLDTLMFLKLNEDVIREAVAKKEQAAKEADTAAATMKAPEWNCPSYPQCGCSHPCDLTNN